MNTQTHGELTDQAEQKQALVTIRSSLNRIIEEGRASEMILVISKGVITIVDEWSDNWYNRIKSISRRIARIPNRDTFASLNPLVRNVVGEWHVSNADLLLWRQVHLEITEYAEGILAGITSAIQQKRAMQALEGYRGLSSEHIALLQQMDFYTNLWRGDFVSLHASGKRPFGDSSVASSVAHILQWPSTAEHELSEDQQERAWELIDELPFALRDVLASTSLQEKASDDGTTRIVK